MKRCALVTLFIIFCLPFLPAEDKPIITVLDFDANEISAAEMKSIISILSSSLFQTEAFTVIDVSQRENVLKEMDFSMSGCTDESCMLEVGKLLSAEGIVVGSIGRVGTKYVLSAKLLETETARTISTADGIYSDLDELLEHIGSIAGKLAKPYIGTPAVAVEDTTPVPEPAPAPEAPPAPAPKPAKEAGRMNIPAFVSLTGSLGCLGSGAYFLAVSLPLLTNFLTAWNAYNDYTGEDRNEATNLWNTAEDFRLLADEGNAQTNFIIGAALAGTGTALGILSVVLFAKPAQQDEPDIAVAFLPGMSVSTLSFRFSF